MNIDEIREGVSRAITAGLLDGRAYDDVKGYIAWLEIANDYLSAELAEERAKNAKWRQAEAEGRLVVLPCKVGNTVYAVNRYYKRIIECSVDYVALDKMPIIYILFDATTTCCECEGCPFSSWSQNMPDCDYSCGGENGNFVIEESDFGKTAFPTREAAEAALQEEAANEKAY